MDEIRNESSGLEIKLVVIRFNWTKDFEHETARQEETRCRRVVTVMQEDRGLCDRGEC